MRYRMHDRCEVQCIDLSVVDSDVRLIWKSEIDVLEVLETGWTCSQHLRHSPSTILHVELLQRLVESLCQIRASGSAFRAPSYQVLYEGEKNNFQCQLSRIFSVWRNIHIFVTPVTLPYHLMFRDNSLEKQIR